MRDVVLEEADASAGGPIESRDAAEDGGLAGPVGTDQPVDGARPDLEAHPVDGAQAAEVQGEIVDGQAGTVFRHRGPCFPRR
jgi:hypothetical protein